MEVEGREKIKGWDGEVAEVGRLDLLSSLRVCFEGDYKNLKSALANKPW